MKHLKTVIFIFALLVFNSVHAHKDRIERPTFYLLYFGKERVEIKSSETTKLKHYNDSIVSRKKQLTHAELFFKTGEIISFKFEKYKCSQIEISSRKRSLFVPQKIVNKISEVHLQTVRLLWSDEKKQAFDSAYFYIEFTIGNKKPEELPDLQIFHENGKFSETIIWNKIDENSKQWKKF